MSNESEELTLDQVLGSAWEKMQSGNDTGTGQVADATPGSAEEISSDIKPIQDKPEGNKEESQQLEEQQRDEKGRFTKAPSSWTSVAKSKWEGLDPEIKSEIDKREADFHKGIEQYKAKAEIADAWEKTISPYLATIRTIGVEPYQAVENIMAFDHAMRNGSNQRKVELINNLAKQFDVDLSILLNNQEGQPYVDPEIASLRNELQELRQMLNSQAQAENQQVISKFRSDPENIYFEAVRADMAAQIRMGVAKDLKEAYDRAIWSNPETRELLLAKQREEEKQRQAKNVENARASASVNIPRRGAVTSVPTEPKFSSFEEAIYAKARELGYDV